MWFTDSSKSSMPDPAKALPGRAEAMKVPEKHFVNGASLTGPFPAGSEVVLRAGLLLGRREEFWQLPGRISPRSAMPGGFTPEPTYREVCSGQTGHAEVVLVVFDPKVVTYEQLLKVFWENHDPTQGMRQGNDVGTQYRSAIYSDRTTSSAGSPRRRATRTSRARRGRLRRHHDRDRARPEFYYAEDYHQQYLAKKPERLLPGSLDRSELPDGFVVTPLQYVE